MENLVDKIIEIDKIAEEKMKVAEKENAAFMRQIDQRKQEIINEIDKSAEAKLKSFEKQKKLQPMKKLQNWNKKNNRQFRSSKQSTRIITNSGRTSLSTAF